MCDQPKEVNIKRKQKVRNKLFFNAIKISDVAYTCKGQESDNCLPTIGRQ